jgi:hypothetical protein
LKIFQKSAIIIIESERGRKKKCTIGRRLLVIVNWFTGPMLTGKRGSFIVQSVMSPSTNVIGMEMRHPLACALFVKPICLIVKGGNGMKMKLWCVDVGSAFSGQIHSKLFLTEAQADDYRRERSHSSYVKVYMVKDIGHFRERNLYDVLEVA